MKKRIVAILLMISLLISVLPVGTVTMGAETESDVTITVLDAEGKNVTDSNLSVKVTRTYTSWFTRTQNVTVTNYGDGVFGYDYASNHSATQYYTINVSLTSDGRTYTASSQVEKDATSVVLTLEEYTQKDKWVTFDVYYIADGHFPESFYGFGDEKDYGPAGNDTPLLKINVNVTKLQSPEYSDVVLYQQNVENAYHFIPATQSDSNDKDTAYTENLEYAEKFWEAVKECMDEESIKAFEATGLYKTFVIYCLKNQGSAASPDTHADGVLKVTPPVYVVEMYDHEGEIFGGYTNDKDTINTNPVNMNQILTAYNTHFDQTIEWTENGEGVWTGSYVIEENGRNYEYTLQIVQTNIKDADDYTSKPANIKYQKKTDTYYLAAFKSATISKERVDIVITYTDGVEDNVFGDQKTTHKKSERAVEFKGNTDRENHIFLGWTVEGGDGTVLTQQEILDKYTSINDDITFVAVYMVAPTKYTGAVEVILNGTYDSTTATATGQRIDITELTSDNVSFYVSADGVEYIPLEHTATGVYSAQLINGTYGIYYFDGSQYVQSSLQYLSINNDNRTRYMFFNSVTYDLNGGVGGPGTLLEYAYTGTSVNVTSQSPTKEGYIFKGWKDQHGNVYGSGDLLTSDIGEAYTLTAQWDDAADIFINVTINHGQEDNYDHTNTKDDVTLDLVYAPDENTPFLEMGDPIVLNSESHEKHTYTYEPADAENDGEKLKTVYTAKVPTVSGVLKENIYTVVTEKHGYDLTSVKTSRTDEGDIIIDLVLDYAPDNADLKFEVKVADEVPDELVPQAAIVKVMFWSTESNRWEFITQHKNDDDRLKPGIRVNIDSETRMGTGYYPVVIEHLMDSKPVPYGYRIVVTSLVYPDGTIVGVNNPADENLAQNNTDIYTIKFGEVTGGKIYGELNGAYFENSVQKGTLDAVITAQSLNVTFDAQGGTVNGLAKETVTNQYKVPAFDGFVPVRDGGYVFEGWYKDLDFKTPAVVGEYLKTDITLYAKWKEPLTVKGYITVGATYEQLNEDGTVSIQKIPDSEWVKNITVILQEIDANGYTQTVMEQPLELNYEKEDFYFGDRKVGFAEYCFDEIPDHGKNYRVQLLIPNYHPTFQNEDDSLDDYLNYPSYNHTDYTAEFGNREPTVANVNIHSHFEPAEFELRYSVNAEAIGEGFIPEEVEILVTFDAINSGVIPHKWPVISQMVFDDELKGDFVQITDGKGNGSNIVWIRRPDGVTNYQYGIRVGQVVSPDGTTEMFSKNSPFDVTYQAPAYNIGDGQDKELIATLTPKTYNITYVTNGGTLSGNYPTKHTWSYETSIAGVEPTFENFKFDGWYLDENLTIPASDYIDASVASDVKFYAKWIQVMDVVDLIVTVKHNQINADGTAGGLAGNYNKTLYTQLTYADRNVPSAEQVYIDMPGYAKEYPDGQWHTNGDKVKEDIFEIPSYYTHLTAEYDYGVNVMLDGYYVSEKSVKKTLQPDGSHLHTVNVTLQYNPDLLDLKFYVSMADSVPKGAYPQSAEVKVTSWYDDPAADIALDWTRITQHARTTITVNIDPDTGYGEAVYPVWQWYDKEKGIPYHYRIEVIQLNSFDGTAIPMSETLADVSYSGNGYNAEVVVGGGSIPGIVDEGQPATKLHGVYGKEANDVYTQQGTVGAVIDINKVIFHANNEDITNDIFRTYYPAGSAASDSGLYTLNQDGTISAFYEIPEFEYYTHNKYIFKGWYHDEDSTDNPVNWNEGYNETTHIYAHWIEVGTVAKEEADEKQTSGDKYTGFNLIGVQIRDKDVDTGRYYGIPASGLRFITVLSEDVYAQINAIEGNGAGAEYGFVLARSSTAQRNAANKEGYTLQYKGENVNGINTTASHNYVQNFKCSGVDDHYAGETYRLYTAVIIYKNQTAEKLEEEYNQNFAARAYIRYYDANGLQRVHYNNYTGTEFYSGCSTSFAAVRDAMTN